MRHNYIIGFHSGSVVREALNDGLYISFVEEALQPFLEFIQRPSVNVQVVMDIRLRNTKYLLMASSQAFYSWTSVYVLLKRKIARQGL